ncbi:replication initiator protein [Microviridae sp.]|nr:replication initiator protein [Microviridae sp.]
MHDQSCFVTLTYDDDHIPYGDTLHKPDFQNFKKRLNKKFIPKNPNEKGSPAYSDYRLRNAIPYFYCGEYGETTARPHYHALLFNWRPDDPELFATNEDANLYTSKTLTELWGMGHCTFGDITFESAAYTARYTTKKITGPAAAEHYTSIDQDTGEVFERLPEYADMSRNPGIGKRWLQKYGHDTYEKDEVIMRGFPMKPPRAYDKDWEIKDPQTWHSVSLKRRSDAVKRLEKVPDFLKSDRRLYSAQIIAEKRLNKRENFK